MKNNIKNPLKYTKANDFLTLEMIFNLYMASLAYSVEIPVLVSDGYNRCR